MTLSTDIVLKDPVPVEQLFKFCQSLLGNPELQKWEHEPTPKYGDNPLYLNEGGQGLSAWLMVHYGADGPLQVDDDESWYKDDPEGLAYHRRYVENMRGCVRVNFDTAYGYKTPNGAGCEDLHAWLVAQVGAWAEQRGVKYTWHQEFTGEWYSSILDVHELGDPVKGALR